MKQSVIPLVTAMVLMGPLQGTADTLPMPLDMPKPFPNIYDLPVNELDPIAMESTRGGLGPLAIALGIAGVDDGTFVRWFDLMGLQRHIKVLGIFARLCFRDGKPSYLNDLPLVINYVLEVLELYASEIVPVANFRKVFLAEVLPSCRQQPWYGRGSAL